MEKSISILREIEKLPEPERRAAAADAQRILFQIETHYGILAEFSGCKKLNGAWVEAR